MPWHSLLGAATILAQNRIPDEAIWAGLALVACLVVGAAILIVVKRWLRPAPPPAGEGELARFRALHEQGILSAQEYERIRTSFAARSSPPVPPAAAEPSDDPK